MIPKGCTAINSFTIPYRENEIETMFITYQQNEITVVEKTIDDCSFKEGSVSVALTQEETLEFKSYVQVRIQIRVKLKDGTVTKSNIITTDVDKVLKEGAI